MVRNLLFATTCVILLTPPVDDLQGQPVTQPFTFSLQPHTIPAIQHGVATWGDFDGDGDLDVFISGIAESGIVTELYRNVGMSADQAPGSGSILEFESQHSDFVKVAYSRAAWGDLDNDGDLDLVVQGSRSTSHPYDPVTIIYENLGTDFVPLSDTDLVGLHSGVVRWADFDNDGREDLLIAGESAAGGRQTHLYKNLGNKRFEEIDSEIVGIAYGDAAWADFDGDGDLDLTIGGVTDHGFTTVIYENIGGAFRLHQSLPASSGFGALDWGDYDGDGDMDLLVSGSRLSPFVLEGAVSIFRNDEGTFNRVDADLRGAVAGSARWGDYDNDGDLDLFLLGSEEIYGDRTARLFTNESGTLRLTTYLIGALFASADWGDFDGDGDLDLLTTGLSSMGPGITNVYENRRQVIPPPAAAPLETSTHVNDGTVEFSWRAADDIPAASYNLRVGSAPGSGDVLSPLSDVRTGKRLVGRPGNAGVGGHWVLRDLSEGVYYWSVQLVDGAFQASPFSEEASFRIEGTPTPTEDNGMPGAFLVHPNYPNPFATTTSLRVDLPRAAHLTIRIFNVLGAEEALLVDDVHAPGSHTYVWSGLAASGHSPAGIYFYRVTAGSHATTGRMIFMP